jgi:hypothetical protein
MINQFSDRGFKIGVGALPTNALNPALNNTIRVLSGADLENECFGFPVISEDLKLGRIQTLYLAGDDALGRAQQLAKAMRAVMNGLHRRVALPGLAGPGDVYFAIAGLEGKLQIWLGGVQSWTNDLPAILSGGFGEIDFTWDIQDRVRQLQQYVSSVSHGLFITGTPAAIQTGGTANGIESFCSGIMSQTPGDKIDWIYLVRARAMPQTMIQDWSNTVAQQSWCFTTTHLQNERYTIENDAITQRCQELFRAKVARYQKGLMVGLWSVGVWFLTNDQNLHSRGKALLSLTFGNEDSLPEPIRILPCRRELPESQWPEISPLTSSEAAIFVSPPHEEYPGYRVTQPLWFGVNSRQITSGVSKIVIGNILHRGNALETPLEIPLADLASHGLIVGTTGSGKTNSCFNILEQIFHQRIPFLVIESAKSEYRNLLGNREIGKKLRIFTVGDETHNPLRINPFEVPSGFPIQSHIDYLKSLFGAAFALWDPMPYVLELAMTEVYEDRGWDIATNRNTREESGQVLSPRRFPTLRELIPKVYEIIDRLKDYSTDVTSNLRTGLAARLDQLQVGGSKGPMFNCLSSVSDEVLFEGPCIIELQRLISDEEKAFLIGLLLLRLLEYRVMIKGGKQTGLRHVTLIEEAHRLLRNVPTQQSAESANPIGKSVEVFSNILAEIRAYGEGILIAEQIPSKLVPDAHKNTNLKIIHRLVDDDERGTMLKAVGIEPERARGLARLNPGEALVFARGFHKPVLTRINRSVIHDTNVEDGEVFRMGSAGPVDFSKKRDLERRNPRSVALIKKAFRRVFNTLFRLDYDPSELPRLNEAVLIEYGNFRKVVFDFISESEEPAAHRLYFYTLLEEQFGAQGQFHRWKLQKIDRVIDAITSMIDIVAATPVKQHPAIPVELWNRVFLAVRDLAYQATPDKRPMSACKLCQTPCLYRWQMNRALYSVPDETFRKARKELTSSTGKEWQAALDYFLRELLRAIRPYFSAGSVELRSALYCMFLLWKEDQSIPFAEDAEQFLAQLILRHERDEMPKA